MNNFTDEELLAYLLGDSDKQDKIKQSLIQGNHLKKRTEELELLFTQLKKSDFSHRRQFSPAKKWRLAFTYCLPIITFMLGLGLEFNFQLLNRSPHNHQKIEIPLSRPLDWTAQNGPQLS